MEMSPSCAGAGSRHVSEVLTILGIVLVIADYVIKVLAIGVLPSNKKPSSAMAWLILILIVPFAGFVIFLFLGRTNVGAKRLARQRRGRGGDPRRDRPAAGRRPSSVRRTSTRSRP